jgi:putative DNA primase/helicase
MNNNFIKTVAASALSSVDQVLNHWLPGGKRVGHEYKPLNPKRDDRNPGSFSINLNDGSWADFATDDKGGDLVSLVAFLDEIHQGEAAKRLAKFLGVKIEKNDSRERPAGDLNGRGNGNVYLNQIKAVNGPSGEHGKERCIMPVPENAPQPPAAHPRHGKPSQRYPYHTLDGQVNFYIDRFDSKNTDDESKQFSPLTLWQNGTVFKWKRKAPPVPAPLFGLPSLDKYPNVDAWLTEGEKAAIALEKLLPNHPVLTWQGGSQAVIKSDYTPLAGRDCIIWPDNDEPGLKAAYKLIKQLQTAKVASVRVLNIRLLKRKDSMPLQPGDDAHDLLAADWTAEQFAEFLAQDDALIDGDVFLSQQTSGDIEAAETKSKPESETPQRNFELLDDGTYFLESIRGGNFHRRKICPRLEVLAQARNVSGSEWGKVVQFFDPDHHTKRLVIPFKSFNGDASDASGRLLSEGLTIAPKSRSLVIEYLQAQNPEKRARTTNRIGWHGEDGELVFVLPEGCIGQSNDEWLYTDNRPDSNLFKKRGTLEDWRKQVAALCVGNSRLIFSLSVAFAAPMLHLINMESGGFHFQGTTSTGKTTLLLVGGSVYGNSEYTELWRSTDNGLEGTALAHCDVLLTLDELKMLDPKIAVESAYMLANGTGKTRANQNGGARDKARWRIFFLSTGEISLIQHVADIGNKIPVGAELRMAEIPADADRGLGCFEELHGYADGDKFAKALKAATNKYFGTAFPAIIDGILQHRKELSDLLIEARQAFLDEALTAKSSGQAQRVAARFALVAAAGELATSWGITGWEQGAAMQAAMTCFKAWLQAFGGDGNKEARNMRSQVLHFFECNGEARFADISRPVSDDTHAARTINKAGWREKNSDGDIEYYCYTEVFRHEICKGFDYRNVARLLKDSGILITDKDHLTTKKTLPGEGRKGVYRIRPAIANDVVKDD